MRFPLLAKVGALAVVGLMLLLALTRIEGLVWERKARGEEAVRGVERSHAAAQSVLGPVLQRFCVEEFDEVKGTGNERVVARGVKRGVRRHSRLRLLRARRRTILMRR